MVCINKRQSFHCPKVRITTLKPYNVKSFGEKKNKNKKKKPKITLTEENRCFAFLLPNWTFFSWLKTQVFNTQCSETLVSSSPEISVTLFLRLTQRGGNDLLQSISSRGPAKIGGPMSVSVCFVEMCVCFMWVFWKFSYPARCFLDLSEMPSRDMSLLNTTIPMSIFTWERQRGVWSESL